MRTFGVCKSWEKFRDDETGSLTIFCLFLDFLTLMMAGMAVDPAQLEHGRVAMQKPTSQIAL